MRVASGRGFSPKDRFINNGQVIKAMRAIFIKQLQRLPKADGRFVKDQLPFYQQWPL